MVTVLERDGLLERLTAAAATGMTPAVWASIQPDKVSVYDPNGRSHTFAQINANA